MCVQSSLQHNFFFKKKTPETGKEDKVNVLEIFIQSFTRFQNCPHQDNRRKL